MFNDSDYCKIEKTYNHLHIVKKLCNYAGQDITRCCIPIPKIRKIVKKFCSRLINKEHHEFMKVTEKNCPWKRKTEFLHEVL